MSAVLDVLNFNKSKHLSLSSQQQTSTSSFSTSTSSTSTLSTSSSSSQIKTVPTNISASPSITNSNKSTSRLFNGFQTNESSNFINVKSDRSTNGLITNPAVNSNLNGLIMITSKNQTRNNFIINTLPNQYNLINSGSSNGSNGFSSALNNSKPIIKEQNNENKLRINVSNYNSASNAQSNLKIAPTKPSNQILLSTSNGLGKSSDTNVFAYPNEPVPIKNETVKVRLLVFVENAEGSRTNIFDSERYTQNMKSTNAISISQQNHQSQQQQQQPQHRQQQSFSTSSSFSINKRKISQSAFKSATSSSPPSQVRTQTKSGNNSSSLASNKNLNNEMINRMVFGSFPMVVSSNRTAIKVHSLKSSNKAMISNVFNFNNLKSQNSNSMRCTCESNSTNLSNSNSKRLRNSKGSDLNQPSGEQKQSADISSNELLDKLNQDKQHSTSQTKASFIPIKTATASTGSTASSYNSNSNFSNIKYFNQNTTNSNGNYMKNKHNLNKSPCSSVPSHYGSNGGIFKRLMRSVSNSLISSNNALSNLNDELNTSHLDNSLTESSNDINNQDLEPNENLAGKMNCQAVASQTPCEKCAEKCLYPKYKIGIAIIFSLPQSNPPSQSLSRQNSINQSTPPVTPKQPTSNLNNSQHSQSSNETMNHHNHHVLFQSPSTSPNTPNLSASPSSPAPTITTISNSMSLDSSLVHNNSKCIPTCSDDFYEFLFSHLPLIEYQFKELKENLINHLPLYFSQRSSAHRSSNSFLANSSSPAFNISTSQQNQQPQMKVNFAHQIILDFEQFKNKFNLIYSSPRLQCPAWLTLISEKKVNNNSLINGLKTSASATSISSDSNQKCANLYNNVLNEFVNLDNLVKANKSKILNNICTNSNSAKTESHSYSSSLSSSLKKVLNFDSLKQSIFSSSHSYSSSSIGNLNQQSPQTPSSSDVLSNMSQLSSKDSTFLSVLLSTILKHHLSWVYTVLPSEECNNDDLDFLTSNQTSESLSGSKGRTHLRKQCAKWTSLLEKTNPYNPLWAQLGDLHGAVNQPLRLVRTVIVGQNRELVERILFLLSYFIRCGNSSYYDISQEKFDFNQITSKKKCASNSDDDSKNSKSSDNSTDRPSESSIGTNTNDDQNVFVFTSDENQNQPKESIDSTHNDESLSNIHELPLIG